MVGTIVSWLVDLVSAGDHKASGSAPSLPPMLPHLLKRADRLPPLHGPCPKESPLCPHCFYLQMHWGRSRHPWRRHLFPWTPLKPSLTPRKSLSFCWSCRGVFLSPATSLSLHTFLLHPSNELTWRAPTSPTSVSNVAKSKPPTRTTMVSHCL